MIEYIYPSQDPTIEQQLESWNFTHPKPDEPSESLIVDGNYSPRKILTEIRAKTEIGVGLMSALEEEAKRADIPVTELVQKAMEANLLRPDVNIKELTQSQYTEDPKVQQALAIRNRYFVGLYELPGVAGLGSIYPGALYITVNLENALHVNEMPTKLENIPTRFEVVGKVILHKT